MKELSMEQLVAFAKRRGFVFPGSEIYGGLANSWDYGPLGTELRRAIKDAWWKRFVLGRGDMVGVETALLMNPKVWEASGHLATFNDPLVECAKCRERFRADQIDTAKCPSCGGKLSEARQFNLMLKTFLGPVEDAANAVYFRPETAQGMFVNFKNVQTTSRRKLPFGIAQIGKAFRNEITPGNFIFRTREFEQMEIEYFIAPPKSDKEWQTTFERWLGEMHAWCAEVGIDKKRVHELEVPKDELAHYSKRTVDLEFDYPFGRKELYGIAYRTDFDLKNHMEKSGEDLRYLDPETNEKTLPHVIEPTFGVDRTVLAVLASCYDEDEAPTAEKGESEARVVLRLPKKIAPVQVAVLPLSKKAELSGPCQELAQSLRASYRVEYDETQSIGKRYRRQDEIGTPYCVTMDFDSLEDKKVTVRDRDAMTQERVGLSELPIYLSEHFA